LRAVHRPLIAAVALGAVTRLAHDLPPEWQWLPKVGVPWLVVAFAVGAAARGTGRGAVDGATCLVAAILVYYALPDVLGRSYYTPLGLWWLLVAAPGGALFGALGAMWRSGRAVVPIAALLTAALAAEALIFALWRTDDSVAGPVLIALAAAALAALVPDSNRRRRAVVLAAVLTFVALVAEVALIRATGYVS
jgi:Family of unknown function (DUF6518)